jgi:hypothetical protein
MSSIKDLTLWDLRVNVKSMGMGNKSQHRKAELQTQLLKKRQSLILKHIDDKDLQKLVDDKNELIQSLENIKILLAKNNIDIENYLKEFNGDDYVEYIC